jgi:hypothetical protein
VKIRSASSERATAQAGLHALRVDAQGGERPAEARDLLRGQVHDRVAAGEGAAQLALARAVECLEVEVRVLEERLAMFARAVREIVDSDDLVVPWSSSSSQTCEPTKPAAPVTPIRFTVPPRMRLPTLELQPLEDAGTDALRDAGHGLAADDLRVHVRGRREREASAREHLRQVAGAAERVHRLVTRARWTTDERISSSRRSGRSCARAEELALDLVERPLVQRRAGRRTSRRRPGDRRRAPGRRRASSRRRSSGARAGRWMFRW